MEQSENKSSTIDIFISHSSVDAEIAKAIINLLRSALNIPAERIRCTSVDGYHLSVGASTDEQLRKEVGESKVFLGLITKASIESAYVLFELGARWGAKLHLAPVLVSSADKSLLRGPLAGLNALSCDMPAQVFQLVSDIASHLINFTIGNPASYQENVDALVRLSKSREGHAQHRVENSGVSVSVNTENIPSTTGPVRPAISVCTTTKRSNPQVERMIRLLMEQTVSGFEYLIIDGYYHTRRDYMARLIDDLNPPFRVRHIPPKPSRWEHIRPALCNALNTGLIWAQGELIVELDDCCIGMAPDWLAKHVEWDVNGFAVSGSWTINGWRDERHERYAKATQIGPELFYSAHRSYPLRKAIEVNGYEELLDGEQGQSDIVLALMLSQVKFMYDPALWVDFHAPSHTLTQLSPDPRKSRWGKEAWAVEPKKRLMSDGTPHYANEWLANEIRAEGRRSPRGNHFALDDLRLVPSSLDFDVDAVQQKLEQYVDTDPHDWRDNEEIAQIRGGEFVHSRDVDVSITQTTVKFAAISPDAKQIVVTSRGSLEKFTRTARKRESIPHDVDASAFYLSPLTGTVLLSSRATRVTRVYSADLTEFEELGESEDVVQALCVSGSERYVAAGGWDCAVHVWNFGTRDLMCSFKKLRGSVTALTFLGDDDRLVAGTLNGDTYLWDLGSRQELTSQKRFDCPISVVYPFTIDDKTLILVGSQDGGLAICDPSSSESHPLLPQDNHRLQSIHVTSSGAYAVSSGSSGEIRVWDMKRRLLLQTILLREPVLAVNLSLELGKIFAIASVGKLLCWSINPRVAQGKFD